MLVLMLDNEYIKILPVILNSRSSIRQTKEYVFMKNDDFNMMINQITSNLFLDSSQL